jgi:hypothetical protein
LNAGSSCSDSASKICEILSRASILRPQIRVDTAAGTIVVDVAKMVTVDGAGTVELRLRTDVIVLRLVMLIVTVVVGGKMLYNKVVSQTALICQKTE